MAATKFVVLAFFTWIAFAHAAPLSKHVVDMSYVYDKDTLHWPTSKDFVLDVVINGTFDLAGHQVWLQSEEYFTSVHSGTHMDAPSHFSPLVFSGIYVDAIPVSTFIVPAAVIDITERANSNPDAEITVEDLTHWEDITGHSLDGTVILLRFGWGQKWGNKTAFYGTPTNDVNQLHFPGLNDESCQWLVENRKIIGVGTEALSFDVGITKTYSCHKFLLGAGLYGLENVANVDKLPLYGATLHIMPMKIAGASGAPTRIIATYPDIFMKE